MPAISEPLIKGKFMIDSGAAISVAPYGSFEDIKLGKSPISHYKLHTTTGKPLNIYGTKLVLFFIW